MPKQLMTLREAKNFAKRDAHENKVETISWQVMRVGGVELFTHIYSYVSEWDDLGLHRTYRIQMFIDGKPRVGDVLNIVNHG